MFVPPTDKESLVVQCPMCKADPDQDCLWSGKTNPPPAIGETHFSRRWAYALYRRGLLT